MTYIIIGSTAAKKHLPDWREPEDLDVLTDLNSNADAYWHPAFREIWDEDVHRYAELDELYTIKISHIYWDLRNGTWEKHAADIKALKAAGARLFPGMHKILYSVWEERYGKKRVDLDMDKQAFFSDAVPRVYDHDSVHYSVAYGDHPLYEDFLKDDQEINIDMAKVWGAPFEQQVRLFRDRKSVV